MLELNGIHLIRTYEKDLNPAVRKVAPRQPTSREPSQPLGGAQGGTAERTQGEDPERTAPAPQHTSGVINFQYVPSGRIHLNHEARQHLVDFFK